MWWLISRQKRDGSWGEKTEQDTDRLVTTCQVVTLLMDSGVNPSSSTIRKAVNFLSRPEWRNYDVGHFTSYWRIEPFSRLMNYYPDLRAEADAELAELTKSVKQGRSPGHTFTLPLFALKCHFLLGKQNDTPAINMIVEKAINDSWVDKNQCFSDRADMTSMAITWLPQVLWPTNVAVLQSDILQSCTNYIVSKATTTEHGTSWNNGFIAPTDYVSINFSEAVNKHTEIAALLPGVKKYLLSRQNKKGFWHRTEGERSPIVQSKEYYTAITLRALLDIIKPDHPYVSPHLWSRQAEKYWRFSKVLTRLATTLSVIGLIYGLFTFLTLIIPNYFASPKAARYESLVLGLLGAVSFFELVYTNITKSKSK